MSTGRWRATALLLVIAETVALFWAYYAFGLGAQVHNLESSSWARAASVGLLVLIEAMLPTRVGLALSAVASLIGLTSLLGQAASVGSVLTSAAGASSLGSAIVAPAYFAFRRLAHGLREPGAGARGPSPRASERAAQELARTVRPVEAKLPDPSRPRTQAHTSS